MIVDQNIDLAQAKYHSDVDHSSSGEEDDSNEDTMGAFLTSTIVQPV